MSHVEKLAVILGVPIIASYMFRHRSLYLGLAVAAIMLGSNFYSGTGPRVLHVERSFFGVLRVTADAAGKQHQLYHGDTIHGRQFADGERRCEPLAYYHRRGPLGEVFEAFNAKAAPSRIAVIGLGTGAMAAYATTGQEWTFYEINPAVVKIAQNRSYFTYLRDCARVPIRTVLGDARLRLQEAPESHYDLIVLDAFSSDAIPVHLITREAIQLYFSKLTPGGMLAFHISNRSLDLSRMLAGVVVGEGLAGFVYDDKVRDAANGKDPSRWAVMARVESHLNGLAGNPHWKTLKTEPRSVMWTDDFSNILHVLKW
jgi:SAM-dependent methyltransferase